MTLKDVRNALVGSFDSVGFSRKDACFVAKRGYFYRHGMTADGAAAAVKTRFPTATILEANDRWHAWPKDSYFEVRFVVE